MNETLEQEKLRYGALQKKLFRFVAESYVNCENVVHFEEGLDSVQIRELADAIADHCRGFAAVFSGADGSGYGFAMVSRSEDLRPLGKAMTAALNGRGGGKPNFQQGRVTAEKNQIENFFAERLNYPLYWTEYRV
jgi:alanyl-tRNA synthetase